MKSDLKALERKILEMENAIFEEQLKMIKAGNLLMDSNGNLVSPAVEPSCVVCREHPGVHHSHHIPEVTMEEVDSAVEWLQAHSDEY